MTRHPIHHRPETSEPIDNSGHGLTPTEVMHQELTPTQHAQLQAIVAHAVTAAQPTMHVPEPADARRGYGVRFSDPGVLIAIVMLALVAIVALVAMFFIALGV